MIGKVKVRAIDPREVQRVATELFEGTLGPGEDVKAARCLHWAVCVKGALILLGVAGKDVLIQGGSASFRGNRLPEPHNTHLSYSFDESLEYETQEWLDQDHLPEIHCWIVWKSHRELIDPSVLWLPQLARLNGIEWSEPEPQEWLWCPFEKLPEGWHYSACLKATKLACELAEDIVAYMERNGVIEAVAEALAEKAALALKRRRQQA